MASKSLERLVEREGLDEEIFVRICPRPCGQPAYATRKRAEGFDAVFVTALGIDRFTGYPHLLTFQAGEVHLDTVSFTIVKCVVLEHVELEIAAELAIDAREQVKIEFCRHAFGVIVRSVEHLGRLDQVYTDDKCRAFSQNICGIT